LASVSAWPFDRGRMWSREGERSGTGLAGSPLGKNK